jgi:hypothetical protein
VILKGIALVIIVALITMLILNHVRADNSVTIIDTFYDIHGNFLGFVKFFSDHE